MRFFPTAALACLSIFCLAGFCAAQAPAQNPNGQTTENQAGSSDLQMEIPRLGVINPLDQVVEPREPAAPEWLPRVNDEHRQFINQLLDYWQTSSDKVNVYQCDFHRYDYDTSICNLRDPQTNQLLAASKMKGEIRFAEPDKAYYETTQVFDFAGLNKESGAPEYQAREQSTNQEKWICDGKSIYEFDFANKRLYETAIPSEMQGKGLVNSPIPFLFGASKNDILNRFWVRLVTPDQVQNEYWLEAVPKKIDDVRHYSRVQLSISRTDFLPVMVQIYAPNYDPEKNKLDSRVFEFQNRKVNSGLAKFQDFFNRFVRPTTPLGWERVARKGLDPSPPFDRSNLDNSAKVPDATQVR